MNLELTIDAEFQSLIAPLTPQEFDLLKAQILEQGCLQPLCVWKTEDGRRILLDGHNRHKICTDHNRRYSTINIPLTSRAHAKLWILEHQAGRRNLNYQLVLRKQKLAKTKITFAVSVEHWTAYSKEH
jgi:hypothetical protein